MGRGRLAAEVLAAMALAVAGCQPGRPAGQGFVREAAGQPDVPLRYPSATYQLARGGRVHMVLFRRLAGEAEPSAGPDAGDFEYVFLDLPERPHYGWVREDAVPAWRWVRQGGRDRVWHAASGRAALGFSPDKASIQARIEATLVPLVPPEGPVEILKGGAVLREDVRRTQGLLNKYGGPLHALVAEAER
jgi:hypothetical protein